MWRIQGKRHRDSFPFNLFHCYAVFGKMLANRLVLPLRSWCLLRQVLDPALYREYLMFPLFVHPNTANPNQSHIASNHWQFNRITTHQESCPRHIRSSPPPHPHSAVQGLYPLYRTRVLFWNMFKLVHCVARTVGRRTVGILL